MSGLSSAELVEFGVKEGHARKVRRLLERHRILSAVVEEKERYERKLAENERRHTVLKRRLTQQVRGAGSGQREPERGSGQSAQQGRRTD